MQEQKIFHKDLTLTNSLFFMDNLALRVKKILLSKLSDSQIELKKQIEIMHNKKIGNRSLLLHPDIFFWIKSQEKNSLEIILKSVLNNFETLQNNKNSLGFFISINYLNKIFNSNRLAKAQRAACEAGGGEISFSIVDADLSLLTESIRLLCDYYPSIMQETENFVNNICFFEGKTIIGFTDFENHGSIFMKYRLVKDNPIRLAEEIVHEAGHTVLNTIMVKDKLILNTKDERYNSPLRQDLRPMFGLFHQLYVLSRLKKFYIAISNAHSLVAQKQLQKICAQQDLAFDIVSKNARFTTFGKQSFNELECNA